MRLLLDTHSFLWFLLDDPKLSKTATLTSLPFHHRDPFDWLIIAQAMGEQIPVIGGDAAFAAYPVTRIW